ncbi:porin family protein [Bradyrhizobium guangdongense]|uniref:outer membrane protein n=1 Tax=Bradyrhizobium guangdongense TaxID=1325090 RepID=UPI00112A5DF0|nr:outer membrane beta-barrel protein [Bradyrhizobium guangdongense]TPQ34765.1 porin family protein [Bradyrhizobium guangdongense]
MKLKLALASAIVMSSISATYAADMAVKAPPPPPIFNWTGFYIGGFVGGAVADGSAFASEPNIVGIPAAFYNGTGFATSYGLGSSFIGGGTIGYNWQRPGSPFVLGIEGEAGYIHLTGARQSVNAALTGLSPIDSVDSTRLGDWYAVIAGRAGWAVNNALFYVKGGAAFIDHSYSFNDSCVGAGPPGCGGGFLVINRSSTQVTYAVGAGVEYAFNNNWSVKGEYLYLGTQKNDSSTATAVAPAGVLYTNTNSDPGIHTGKIGINYRWGGPVVAKY